MTALSLADRLNAARQRFFVGREAERSLFRDALVAPELPFNLLHIYGPGGIGKTTLLGEFRRVCAQNQVPIIYLDGRNLEPSPEPFMQALQQTLQLEPTQSPIDYLNGQEQRRILMLDTYELLAPLDNWLREVFLPQLPQDILTIVASRYAPSDGWRSDPGWQTLLQVLPLRNLRPEESIVYLSNRQIPAEQHQQVLNFTHGHPLALSLVADVFAQRSETVFQPETSPDVVRALLERLIEKVPDVSYRTALEVCSLIRLTTEPLLATVLQIEDAHPVFEWLRDLSFIEAGRQGLFPHDLAREVLSSDLQWRNSDWYDQIHQRIRSYYAGRLQASNERDRQRVLLDYIYLHRNNYVLKTYFVNSPISWQDNGGLLTDIMRPSDKAKLIEMVEKHEGEESAEYAAFWFDRQPQGVTVLRNMEQKPVGFMAMVDLQLATPEEIAADPATSAAWSFLQANSPLREGDSATLLRFWMDAENYQSFCAVQGIIGVNVILHYLTTPNLVYSFFTCADPDFWSVVFAYADLERIPAADFEIDSRHYGVYGHNWRTTPAVAWLNLLAEREHALSPQVVAPPKPTENLMVLSEPEFFAAVQEALRNLSHLDSLRSNPLLHSRLVLEKMKNSTNTNKSITILQNLIKEATDLLQASPRDNKLYRVLYHTYLHPAENQQQASELLDLPFSTYRRHLKAGVNRVAEVLWQWELQGVAN